MRSREKPTQGAGSSTSTTSRTSTMTAGTTTTEVREEEWWEKLLFTISLLAAAGILASFEYRAGEKGGFGGWSFLVIAAVDVYVLWTWLDARVRLLDELIAVGILVGSVSLQMWLSTDQPRQRWQAFGIGVIVIVVEWRLVSRRREKLARPDVIAAVTARLDAAIAKVTELEGEAKELRRQVAAGVLNPAPPPVPPVVPPVTPSGDGADPVPTGAGVRVMGEQIEWLRRRLAEDPTYSNAAAASALGVSEKTAERRMAIARKPHALGVGA
jgi:hypothetical protein